MKTAMQVSRTPSKETLARLKREYMDAIQPIIKAKCDLMNKCLPRITIFSSGEVKKEYDFTEDQKLLLENADKAIEHIRKTIYKDYF